MGKIISRAPRDRKDFIRALKVVAILGFAMMFYGAAGLTYTLVSNHSHVAFSFNTGAPIVATIIPGTTNLTAVNFTVRVFNTASSAISGLFVNVTIDAHPPNATATSFVLNAIPAPNQSNPQWITNGPFSLASNQAMQFNYTFRYSGVLGFYDIDASVVKGA